MLPEARTPDRAALHPPQSRPLHEQLLPALAFTLIYFAFALYRSLHHVMWEDEWVLWVRAHAEHSLTQALTSARYDGHPPGWYLLIYLFTRFTNDPSWLKVLHVVMASATVFLIWRYGPFSLLEKLLLPLGYFFFFEYSTLTRSYGPGILFAILCAVLFRRAVRSPLILAPLILLLSQFSIYSLLLAIAITLGVAVELHRSKQSIHQSILLLGVLLLSLALFYLEIRPPADARTAELMDIGNGLHPAPAAAAMFDALIPLPALPLHWWNHPLIPWPDLVRGIFGVALIALATFTLRTRSARTLFLLCATGVFFITLIIYTGFMRHWGHLFIGYILALWIDRLLTNDKPACSQRLFLIPLLCIHVIGGAMAATFDLRQPFTSAPQAAQFIGQNVPHLPIAGDFDYALSPLAANLHRPLWFIRSKQYAWAARYDTHRRINVTIPLILTQCHDLALREHADVLLVLTYAIPLPKDFIPITHIPSSTVENEDFYLYRYKLPPN